MDFNEKKDKVYTLKDWIKLGVIFGLVMFLINSIIFPVFFGEGITLKTLVVGIISCVVGGFVYALVMKLFSKKKKR